MEYANRITDLETAFNLLHLLEHLNGTVIASIDRQVTLECINPAIFRMLICHHRARGGNYRLHVHTYGIWMARNLPMASIRFLIPSRISTTNQRSVADDTFVHARALLGMVNPGSTNLIWEMAATAGLYSRKLDIMTSPESEWTTAQEHTLMNEMVEVGLFAAGEMD